MSLRLGWEEVMNDKKLGIIAGMGPFAATYFIKRVLEFTDAEKEWDNFRMLVDYNVFIPSRTRALLYGETSPKQEIINTINGLEKMGADMIAVPCNSAHGWYEEVSDNINLHWLNIIQVTSDAVKKRHIDKALIISAYVPYAKKLYDKFIDTVYPTKQEQESIYKLIERLKLGESPVIIKRDFHDIIYQYEDKVDGIVIACTEPSMLFRKDEYVFNGFKIVDSTNEYAKKCVEIIKGEE